MERKIGIILFLILAGAGLVLGFRYLNAHVRSPFYNVLYYDGPEYVTLAEQELAEREEQKKTDTDGDGLNDYDEMYVYDTSPYLTDSDSDGYDDKAEVYGGQDPNCPEGKDCGSYFASADATGSAVAASDFIGGIPNSGIDENGAGTTFETEEDIMNYFSSLSADEIREVMIASGVPAETLDQVSDEELIELFNAALANAEDTGAFANIVTDYANNQE